MSEDNGWSADGRLPRRRAADTIAPSGPVVYGLPPELQALSVERIGAMSAGFAGTMSCILALHHGARQLGWHAIADSMVGGAAGNVVAAVLIILSLGMVLLTRVDELHSRQIVDLGCVYAVVVSFGVAMLENFVMWPEGGPVRGVSWVCLWVVLFPIIVPTTPGKALLTIIMSAAMGPLAFVVTVAAGYESPPLATVLALFSPNVAAVLLAWIAARLMYRLGTDVTRARQMGAYELVEQIGQGGMGEVWRATHRRLARQAAVKYIRPDRARFGSALDTKVIRRFEREANATAMLRSPHTVQLYDFGFAQDGTVYYVMELLNGIDLESLVERFGPVPARRVVYLLTQVCASLAEAHELRLIHRDIKPANLFSCRLGTEYDFIKVLDFGLVRPTGTDATGGDKLTRESMITGTPAYMPPEMIFKGRKVDHRADLYALGCVAYWLLTGQRVFDDDEPLAVLLSHANSDPVPPSERTEVDIPARLEAAVLSCLAKSPQDRPADATTLAVALRDVPFDDPWTPAAAERWWRHHLPEKTVSLATLRGCVDAPRDADGA